MAAVSIIGSKFGTAKVDTRNSLESISNVFEAFAFYGLAVSIFFFAIPYGTVESSHKSLLVVLICVFAAARIAASVLRGSFRLADPMMMLPLAGILGLAVIQIAPATFGLATIAVDPYETRAFIFIFGALVVAGEILLLYTNTEHRLKILVGLVIAVGAASSIFGFLREVYLDSHSNLLIGYLSPGQGYAQFINRNHFAFLMEMAIGLVFGLLIKGELGEKFKFFGWILAAVMLYSMITANSRGGLLGLAALSLFAVFVHVITRRDSTSRESYEGGRSTGRRILAATGLCGLMFGLIVVTIAFVGGDSVVTRIERLQGEVTTVENSAVNRSAIWISTIELIKERPILGVGFGGFMTAIPKYDTSGGNLSLQQAHNDYLELLASGGIVGFILFTGFFAIAACRASKNLRSGSTLIRSSTFGAMIGMFGVLIHSFVDFGLHIMINALIFTVLVVIASSNIPETAKNLAKMSRSDLI